MVKRAKLWQKFTMELLTRYILKKYLIAAAGIAFLLCFLGWLVQLLRAVDLVTNKGQGFGAMVYQSFLSLPDILNIVLFLCVALGVSRTVRGLQLSKEIFPIYAGVGLRPLIRSWVWFMGLSIIVSLSLAHFVVPTAKYYIAVQSDEISADLVANSSRPGRFTQVSSGLTMMIRERAPDGTGLGFFIYDTRDPLRSQTIVAEESQLAQVEGTLTVRLSRGAIQYYTYETGKMTGLEFETYSLALADLAGSNAADSVTPNSLLLLTQMAADGLSGRDRLNFHLRNTTALYVLTMGLLAFFMVSRPNTMRGKSRISVDFVVLAIAVVVKVIGTGLEQFIYRTPDLWFVAYLPPLLPLLIAIPMIMRQGLLSRTPKLGDVA
ncbi:lipopolysaccharide export LptBFGC system permease protein LptF [Maritalea mobilis]|uniref:Lipopolysaccharide export LptBFGC system permease protein LptF n=2 Tax=Maritalea mobilis TaxID=483324 RepID=A0A4R6VJ61_9HYPH|nr:lipopolysaccharide export LptBFGC system permease protein LptF [Maritalea mobilis]